MPYRMDSIPMLRVGSSMKRMQSYRNLPLLTSLILLMISPWYRQMARSYMIRWTIRSILT